MNDIGNKADQLILMKYRHREVNVWQMRATRHMRIIADKHIARLNCVAILLQNTRHQP